ncbi:sugar ABC transporter ATP-binding protein [Variovorax dokdonensis]|uniref:Sugar ABC transporter ATP-binding protein n=1 Tax=Variovorax dokdonensis TaxID=344883 RepID=A0ABT7N943_9BURK|nr:sugar ABC transporter ATP-binding protein [Variovorax dokdonensis]MDM0044458.1 sugar ABC transporter ATP-binding protein [Variovorax dokdonensis]
MNAVAQAQAHASAAAVPALAFEGIVKRFGPVQVLHGVSFALQPGRIVGLLGENGAGKSTLMKIASGYEAPSEGVVTVGGRAVSFDGPRAAENEGIVLIHQEFNLAEDLTVAQNIHLGHEKRGRFLLDDNAMRQSAAQVLAEVGLARHPDTPVRQLIVAEKQLVEIAKALSKRARILIMDEPTATLTPGETQRLFALMRRLQGEGVTIVYISHKLDEVEHICDEVVVMRDGRFVAREATDALTRLQMAQLMVGRELSDLYPPRTPAPADDAAPLLRVRGLTVPGWAQDVGFDLRPGEILGFAGLVGAGRTELFEGLLGLRAASAQVIEIGGRPVRISSPGQAARQGLVYLSEDRKGKGLHVDFGLAENLTLMDLGRYASPWLDRAREQAALRDAVAEYGIRTGALDVRASSLSGGNQQKLALAKVLQPRPRIVILDEPTRGVDIGAKREIYLLIRRLAEEGKGVIVVSSELMELIGLAHRVAVMRAGHLQTVLPNEGLTEEELIAHATGTH